jgi:hypothetical protein
MSTQAPPKDFVEKMNAANEALDELDMTGWDWRLELVPVDDTYSGRYQRVLDERWLKKRELDFKPWLLGTIIVSERHQKGKRFSLVDGQHRQELAKRNDIPHLAAVVFYDLTEAQEAALFSAFNNERRATSAYQTHHADVIAKDARALGLEKVIAKEGFILQDAIEYAGEYSIKAIRQAYRIYDDDPAMLGLVLRLIHDSFRDLPYAQNQAMIRGVYLFLKDNPDVAEDRFVDRLSAVTPSTIFDRAGSLRKGRGDKGPLPGYVAEAIANEYRRTRRSR